MIHGHLADGDGWRHLRDNDAWRTVFDWLMGLPPAPERGIVHLRGDDIWANIHGYDTVPREACRFESHRRYVDLQYCIAGGEIIEWRRAGTLSPDGDYDVERDLQFYLPGDSQTVLHMLPGNYAVFHPSDAHAPRRMDGIHAMVEKLVVKVALELV